jgi:hypothetical protein
MIFTLANEFGGQFTGESETSGTNILVYNILIHDTPHSIIELRASLNIVVHNNLESLGASHLKASGTLILIIGLDRAVNELPHSIINLSVSGELLVGESESVVGVVCDILHSFTSLVSCFVYATNIV